jgi:hypothetical protein
MLCFIALLPNTALLGSQCGTLRQLQKYQAGGNLIYGTWTVSCLDVDFDALCKKPFVVLYSGSTGSTIPHRRATLNTSIQHVPTTAPSCLTLGSKQRLCHLLCLHLQAHDAKSQHAACAKRCSVLPDALRFFVQQMCHLLCLHLQAHDAKSQHAASATRCSACLTLGSKQRLCHLLCLHLQALDAKSKQMICASRH